MLDSNYLEKVAEFQRTFGAPIKMAPTIPADRATLRVELIREEFKELEEAVEHKNIIAVADALADLQYVLSGAILEFGMGKAFKDIFDNVHESNMSKACSTEDQVKRTMEFYEKRDTPVVRKSFNGKTVICRKSDNKILKNIDYIPADPAKFLK